jgi:Domain of unknown function (DUF5668)
MDDQTPNPTTRVDTPEPPPTGYGFNSTPPPPPPSPGVPPPPAPPPTSGWDQSYRHQHRDRDGRLWSVVVGLVILGLGVWFFAEKTLHLDMPDIRWNQLWPVILIVIGVLVLVGATRRDRH